MSQKARGARERAIRVNAEAGGAPPKAKPKPRKPPVEERILNHLADHPGSTMAKTQRALDLSEAEVWKTFAKLAEAAKIRLEPNGGWVIRPPFRFLISRAQPVKNLAASRGDVIKLGARSVVVTQVEWRGEAWAVEHLDLVDRGRALTHGLEVTTWFGPTAAPEPIGRWTGLLEPGSTGSVALEESAVDSGSIADPNPNRSTREATMATKVVRRSTKPAAKKAAKAKPASATAETTEETTATTTTSKPRVDYAGRVEEFVAHLTGGGTMRALKQKVGVSADTGIREALYRAGYDSKGNAHGIEENDKATLTPAKLRDFLVKERGEGAAWYVLSYRTGKTESEIKAIISEAGGTTERVYTRTEKPAKEAKEGDDAGTAKSAKTAAARKGTGKKVVKRAAKANPSK